MDENENIVLLHLSLLSQYPLVIHLILHDLIFVMNAFF